MCLPLILATLFWRPWYIVHGFLFNCKVSMEKEERNQCYGTKTFSLKKECTSTHTHTKKKMWDFYESYPVIFHFFPATSFLEQNPRKPKKTICAVSKNFAKLNYVIHLADLMSSWMQFANLHFGHKEIMHLLYMKKQCLLRNHIL